jgi:hypothetical protein
MLLVVGDVSVDSKASVLTSLISRFADLIWFFRDAHRSRVCVHTFIVMSIHMCLCVSTCVIESHKKLEYSFFWG